MVEKRGRLTLAHNARGLFEGVQQQILVLMPRPKRWRGWFKKEADLKQKEKHRGAGGRAAISGTVLSSSLLTTSSYYYYYCVVYG